MSSEENTFFLPNKKTIVIICYNHIIIIKYSMTFEEHLCEGLTNSD